MSDEQPEIGHAGGSVLPADQVKVNVLLRDGQRQEEDQTAQKNHHDIEAHLTELRASIDRVSE